MAALNCGLAAYIERVRKLESDNAALCRALQEREASSVREAKATKELYEAELRRMLKKLDRLAEERASLQLEFDVSIIPLYLSNLKVLRSLVIDVTIIITLFAR